VKTGTVIEQSPRLEGTNGLDGCSIIYFGNDWSAENRTSSHHIARRLANRMPLLYVEVPGLRAPKASRRDIGKLYRKLKQGVSAPREVGRQMWCITVPQLPWRRLAPMRWINLLFGRYIVRRAIQRLRFRRTISWFVVPHPAALAGCFSEELIVYYCIDDYASLPGVDRREIARLDEELTQRANQVFVASSTLLDRKRKLNASVAHSPHGVDVDLFNQASIADLKVAENAQRLKHPVIGFFGLIEAWIDLDLIAFLARSRPHWTFLLVGHIAVELNGLDKLSNVVFAGPQPYETLPRWAKAFDVAIVPYRLTQQVLCANPLKLREYLATGKPIVAVPTPEIRNFSAHVSIAENHVQFLNSIENALLHDCAKARDARMAAVAGMSWDIRVKEVLALVGRKLEEALVRNHAVSDAAGGTLYTKPGRAPK